MFKYSKLTSFVIILYSVTALGSELPTKLTVLTNTWQPYINPSKEPSGQAALLVEMLAFQAEKEVEWQYFPFQFNYQQVANARSMIAFPYFKTAEREQKVLFSKPVFYATSRLYYNRQYFNEADIKNRWESLVLGRVKGYSYGENLDAKLDNAIVFTDEQSALFALFNNDIQILPMTQGVLTHTLEQSFPNRLELIRPVPSIEETSALHFIVAKNQQGQQIVQWLNSQIDKLLDSHSEPVKARESRSKGSINLAQLVAAEGYPVILGEEKNPQGLAANNKDSQVYYTLVQGTRVAIVEWSEKMLKPSQNDRLYQNMIEQSKVVILNGPHIGRELWIRNLHIQLL